MAKSNVTRRRALDNVRPRIVATVDDPSLLDEMFQAARDFGPQYGYRNAEDWWDTQTRMYPELFDGTYGEPIERPEWVSTLPVSADTGEVSDDEQAALTYLASYEGSFDFLVDLRQRVRQGRDLTERQVAAVLRCKSRDEDRQANTDPRLEEAKKYLGALNLAGKLNEFTLSLYNQLQSRGTLSERQIDALLRRRQDQPRAEQRGPAVTEDGMYRTADGTIYKVQVAVNGSGRLYAKRLVPPAEFGGRARFVYEAGAVNRLRPEDKMTLEEARKFGALYGTCCVCGRTLTDETSISHGIGPVCEGRTTWGS